MTTETRVLSGRYRVDDLIGRGGMASVYRGYDQTLGRTVAIKILKADLAGDAAFRTRFRLEAQAASRMAHPTIVRVFDAGEDVEVGADGHERPVPYIVMELVHGRLLKDVVATGPVPIDDALRYVDGILEALEYSHRAGVVHRDIKPGNVMITDSGRIKVMDFGIARAVSDSSSTVAARADLYSAGVVLYELLTGRPPFRGDTPVAVAYQHVSEAPLPPSEINDAVPRALDAVVLRALAKDPFQRPQDAAAFREDLDATIEGKEPTKRQMSALSNELYGPNPRQAAETARSLRQLSTDTTMRRTQPGPPVAWIWAGVAVLAVLLVSVLLWVIQIQPSTDVPSAGRTVPNVVDMTYDEAVQSLEKEDLTAKRIDVADASIAAGNVVRTTPGADTSVAAGQEISLYVSSGADTAKVPTLEGITESEARAALESAGLSLGLVQRKPDPALAAGVVMTASVAAGTEVTKGTTVNLVVASGTVVIVNYEGYPVDVAKRELESDEKQLTVQTQEDAGCPATTPSLVKTQSLAPGEVPVHSEITLTYCTGP